MQSYLEKLVMDNQREQWQQDFTYYSCKKRHTSEETITKCGRIFVARLMWYGKFLFNILSNLQYFLWRLAGVYTEETLQPLNKTQLIKLFLKTQEQTNNISYNNQ